MQAIESTGEQQLPGDESQLMSLRWKTSMRSDTLVRMEGMDALIERLGMVDAERFVALMNREPFDYTEWRRCRFEDMDVRELSRIALAARKDGSAAEL